MQKYAYANIRKRVSLWLVQHCSCWGCSCSSSSSLFFSVPTEEEASLFLESNLSPPLSPSIPTSHVLLLPVAFPLICKSLINSMGRLEAQALHINDHPMLSLWPSSWSLSKSRPHPVSQAPNPQLLVLQLLSPPSTTSTLCHRVCSLLTPSLVPHVPDFTQTQAP